MAPPQPKVLNDKHYTYADYRNFPADERWEIIDGEAFCLSATQDRQRRHHADPTVAMSPAPTIGHQRVVGEVYRQVANQLHEKTCEAVLAPYDVLFAEANEADEEVNTVLQPDVMVFCDPTKVGRKFARGAPDWVVEVLSPSTSSRDQVQKRRKYQQAGVREYWLVDPQERLLFVNRLIDGHFFSEDPAELVGKTAVTALEGVVVEWDALAQKLAEPADQE